MEYKTRKWHDKCFQCVVCKSLVGSKPFIIPNETDVYCVSCFEEKFATKCTKCKKIMTTGGVTFKNEVGIFRIYLTSWQLYPYFASILLGMASRMFCVYQLRMHSSRPEICIAARQTLLRQLLRRTFRQEMYGLQQTYYRSRRNSIYFF